MQNTSRLKERARKSPRGFFNSAVNIQNTAPDPAREEKTNISFATRKLAESCDILVEIGFCGGCRDCHHCELQRAHNMAVERIEAFTPEERAKAIEERNAHSPEEKFLRKTEHNGHRCEVARYY